MLGFFLWLSVHPNSIEILLMFQNPAPPEMYKNPANNGRFSISAWKAGFLLPINNPFPGFMNPQFFCEKNNVTHLPNEPQKKTTTLTFHESSWLFNDGILISWFMKQSPHNWVPYFIPLYLLQTTETGPFFHGSNGWLQKQILSGVIQGCGARNLYM